MNAFTLFTNQENNDEEMIADVILNSAEISDDIEGNEIASDWTEMFCEYNIDDQLDGSLCYLSQSDEE